MILLDPEIAFLSVAEVRLLLTSLKERRIVNKKRSYQVYRHPHPAHILTLSSPFEKTLEYANQFATTTENSKTRKISQVLSQYEKVHEYESAALWNLMPSKPEEARSLIKSLERFEDKEEDRKYLEGVLKEIDVLKKEQRFSDLFD